ncbi:MAG TPA: zinc ribbon domain-containing protein [Polyangiaceae bacterium]|jgi:hypothetical protein
MRCPQCGLENPGSNTFCQSCGARVPSEPAGDAGRAPAAQPSGPRCGRCGSARSAPAAVGPQLIVRVQTAAGGTADLPLSAAAVCLDCGAATLMLQEEARRYLAGMAGG